VFEGAYNDVSYFAGHNPGISILGGLAVVSVTEPLALPWVALGTATPFILGYRVVGDKLSFFTNSTVKPFLEISQLSSLCLECLPPHH
jgi:hypothetical protein